MTARNTSLFNDLWNALCKILLKYLMADPTNAIRLYFEYFNCHSF